MNETNNNEISPNKFENITNQELIEEYCRRAKEGKISKDELILALVKAY